MTCIVISRQDQTFIQQAKQTNEKKPPKNIISKIHHMDHEMWYEYFNCLFHHSVTLATFILNTLSKFLGWNISPSIKIH